MSDEFQKEREQLIAVIVNAEADAAEWKSAAEEKFVENEMLKTKLDKILLACDPKHPGAVIHASNILEILRG